jgi:hypothetical protein
LALSLSAEKTGLKNKALEREKFKGVKTSNGLYVIGRRICGKKKPRRPSVGSAFSSDLVRSFPRVTLIAPGTVRSTRESWWRMATG